VDIRTPDSPRGKLSDYLTSSARWSIRIRSKTDWNASRSPAPRATYPP
jgi:hypothetical protein